MNTSYPFLQGVGSRPKVRNRKSKKTGRVRLSSELSCIHIHVTFQANQILSSPPTSTLIQNEALSICLDESSHFRKCQVKPESSALIHSPCESLSLLYIMHNFYFTFSYPVDSSDTQSFIIIIMIVGVPATPSCSLCIKSFWCDYNAFTAPPTFLP